MFGSTPISAALGAGTQLSSDPVEMRAFVRQATSAGLALLVISPGTKLPYDARTDQQKRKDDKAAQDAAMAEGNPNFHRVKAPSGLHLATSDAKTALRYFERAAKLFNEPVNYAIEVGRSNIIIVDVDTPEEKNAFLNWLSAETGQSMHHLTPTVSSPGVYDQEKGEWIHWGGGHYYFTLPEGVTLPQDMGNYTHQTAAGKFSVAWGGRYILIPPSRRPEGSYTFTGLDMPAPACLLEMINGRLKQAQENRERMAANRAADGGEFDDAIEAWAESISWDDILSPHGWVPTMDPDRCGCSTWTAPGFHGSAKSATAHDGSCSLGRYTVANAPLHIWTDHTDAVVDAWMSEKNTKTLTKLQLVAAYEFEGDTASACRELGLATQSPSGGTALSDEDLRINTGTMQAKASVDWQLPEVAPMLPPQVPVAEPVLAVDLFMCNGFTELIDHVPPDLFASPDPSSYFEPDLFATPDPASYGHDDDVSDVIDMFASPSAHAQDKTHSVGDASHTYPWVSIYSAWE